MLRTTAPSLRQNVLVLLTLCAATGSAAAQQTPAAQRLAWYERHAQMREQSPFRNLAWQHLGPTNISGRVTDIAVVEPRGKSYEVWVGTATGGVWKSVNEGVSWEPVFQHAASTSTGDIAIDPKNRSVVWVGTGEANIFRSSNAGSGIYKTTDGGRTWTHMGLGDSHTIARIVIDPDNTNTVYVAAAGHEWTHNPDRGLYKTTNGGRTWSRIHYIDEQTGAIDLVMDPRDSKTLYLSTWQRVRRKWNDPRVEPGYQHSGLHKSTDGGATWKPINSGLPAPQHRGRIGIDISRSNPNILYAFVDNYEIARAARPGELNAYGVQAADVIRGATLYRSDNRGETWRKVSQDSRDMETLAGTYGWVFGQIRVDPVNPEKIFLLGVPLVVSEDGGRTVRELDGMHGDHHGMWIDPANPDYILNANDGGIYASYDGGRNWRFWVDVPVVQFFNVALDNADTIRAYGSIQDHGSRRGIIDLSRGRSQIPAVAWENAPGGEGTHHAVDPRDAALVYATSFYGRIFRQNLRTGERKDIVPQVRQGEPPLRMQWLTPILLSPHNPDVVYHGSQYVHRSMDRGDSWERISGDLTTNNPAQLGDIPYQTIFSLAESPLRFGWLYAGTDDGRLHVTPDGGKTWSEIGKSLPANKFVAEIVPSLYDESTVYVALNGKRDDDFTPYVFKSSDGGRTWQSIVGNIPSGPVNVIREDPKNRNVLYVGTDIGAYVSIDAGRSWSVLPGNLPSTYVHDLAVHPREDLLVAATHGRGMFALDVRPIQKLTPAVMSRPVAVLDPTPAQLRRPGQPTGSPAQVWYWLSNAGAVSIVIKDASGRTVADLRGTGDAGLNVVSWSGVPTTVLLSSENERQRDEAQVAQPGVYSVEIRQGNNVATTLLQVSR